MKKAIIFDLDDTLISEKEYIKSGFKEIAKYIKRRYNLNENDTFDKLIKLSNTDSRNVFNRMLEQEKILYTELEIKELISIYRKHKPNIKFYDDVLPTIEKMKKLGIKVGIITDGYKETQKLKLEALDAYSIFDEIIITDDLGREYWKPNPKAFEIMSKNLNIEFNDMIYIGDNPEKDFYIGNIYPITTVRIIREDGVYRNNNYLDDIVEKYKINSLNDILV